MNEEDQRGFVKAIGKLLSEGIHTVYDVCEGGDAVVGMELGKFYREICEACSQ